MTTHSSRVSSISIRGSSRGQYVPSFAKPQWEPTLCAVDFAAPQSCWSSAQACRQKKQAMRAGSHGLPPKRRGHAKRQEGEQASDR